jgi:hypothetical protein
LAGISPRRMRQNRQLLSAVMNRRSWRRIAFAALQREAGS